MQANDLLIDTFNRIKEEVHDCLKGLSEKQLSYRPSEEANNIGWLIWHLTRIQDDHMADLTKDAQVYESWRAKFKLPFDNDDTGYGHTSSQVASVKVSVKDLQDYYDAVHAKSIKYLRTLKDSDYSLVVDKRWNPPVTLGVRLVSVISDSLQHVGQAAYIKGLLK